MYVMSHEHNATAELKGALHTQFCMSRGTLLLEEKNTTKPAQATHRSAPALKNFYAQAHVESRTPTYMDVLQYRADWSTVRLYDPLHPSLQNSLVSACRNESETCVNAILVFRR